MVSTDNLQLGLDPDLQRGLRDEVPRVLAASEVQLCRNLSSNVDLRSFDLPEARRDEYSLRTRISRLHLCRGFYAIRPFLKEDIPLGPLVNVQVYSTNAYGEWASSAHAPTRCSYRKEIDLDDDLLELSEWLTIYKRSLDCQHDRLCSYCGGFAIRRFDEPLLSYWKDACRMDDLQESVAWHVNNRAVHVLEHSVLSDDAASCLTEIEAELREIAQRQAELRGGAMRVANDAHSAARQARPYPNN